MGEKAVRGYGEQRVSGRTRRLLVEQMLLGSDDGRPLHPHAMVAATSIWRQHLN